MSDGLTRGEELLREAAARGGEQAAKVVEEKGPDWITSALARAEAKALDVWPDDGSGKVDPRRAVALAALGPLKDEAVKGAIARQGRDRLERLLIRVGAGEDVGAATYAALEGASADELLDALGASTDRTIGAATQRIEDARAVREALLRVGQVALKLLVPLLLAAL